MKHFAVPIRTADEDLRAEQLPIPFSRISQAPLFGLSPLYRTSDCFHEYMGPYVKYIALYVLCVFQNYIKTIRHGS